MEKIRILAAGDFHGNKGIARKLADLAEKENVDLIILNGDITIHMALSAILPIKIKK